MVAWTSVEHACNRLVHLVEVCVVGRSKLVIVPVEHSEIALLTNPFIVLVTHSSHLGCLEELDNPWPAVELPLFGAPQEQMPL